MGFEYGNTDALGSEDSVTPSDLLNFLEDFSCWYRDMGETPKMIFDLITDPSSLRRIKLNGARKHSWHNVDLQDQDLD